MSKELTVAVAQQAPRLLDRAGSIEAAAAEIHAAAGEGARLVVFPEAYVPGYPAWIWRLEPGAAEDFGYTSGLHARLLEESIDLASDQLDPIKQAAAETGAWAVVGINERDVEFGRSSVYNSMIYVSPDGEVVNRHRKLMPTFAERMVWSMGDASGLRTVDTGEGRIGGLICWENYMPLARTALYAQGLDVYVAPTWDEGQNWYSTLRHIAIEGRCWVVGASSALQGRTVPRDIPGRDRWVDAEDAWVNHGGSMIVSPRGEIVAGPLEDEYGRLLATIDLTRSDSARTTFDVAGHYSRPDVFSLSVDRRAREQVDFRE